MTEGSRKVIALGSPTGEHRAAVEAAARKAGAELSITRESAKALADIEREPALAVLIDMSALGAEHFCRKARANERLRRVPIIGLSRNPGELSFNRTFAWGADDLVPLGAEGPLAARLLALGESAVASEGGFGQAVVAESNAERCTLLGRVLTQAGYDVKYAVDATSAEFYASQSETRVVVLNAGLTPPRKLIEAVEQAGALPVWVVIAEQRSLTKMAQGLNGIDRVVVTSSSGSPEDILFVANELVFSRGTKRSEWRALYGAPVQFHGDGEDSTEYGFTYDVSPNGMYVRSLLPCDFAEVWLELRPPRREKLVRLHGRIVRRFRFGSGSIASAPPGFGVRLDGPADDADLMTWVEACREFLGTPGQLAEVSGGAPVIGAKDGTFKRPTPLGTPRPSLPAPDGGEPRAVNRPLPADLRAKPSLAPEAAPAEPAPVLDEIDEVLGMVNAPAQSHARDSMHSDVGQMLADTLGEERVESSGALPVTMTFDTKAVIQQPAPEAAEKPQPRPAPAATVTAAAVAPPAPARTPTPAAAAPVKLASAKATLMMGAAPVPAPAAPPPEPAKAADMRRTAPDTPLARTLESPGPVSARQPGMTGSPEEINAPTVPAPADAAALAALVIPKQSPLPSPQAPPAAKAPLPAAAWASIAAAPSPAPTIKTKNSRGPVILAAVLGFAAVVGAVIAGFLLGLIPTGGASAQRASQPERVSTPTEVKSAAPVATVATQKASATAKEAPSAAAPRVAVSAAPSAPTASAAATLPAPSAAPPSAAPPDVDLSALTATQGYLYVRSSASTKVFVMGKEVGTTNQPIPTSCGTRFVRIGPSLGNFSEPGGPVIIKCSALTEVKREPR